MVNYHVLPKSLVVSFNGELFTVNKDDKKYNKIIDLIKENKLDDIPTLFITNNDLGNELTITDNGIMYKGELLPQSISMRVEQFYHEGLPFKYLLNFYEKLKLNPSFNSREMLYKFLEHNGHPITENGNFIAYRGVTSDFKDCHTRTFDNSIGSICEMDRSLVDDNPNNTCSKGLHVACYSYANSFGSETVEVEVNPMDVVTVPTDYNGTKMRVCKFKVLNVCKNMRSEVLYGHDNYSFAFNIGDDVTVISEVLGDNGEIYDRFITLELISIDDDVVTLIDDNGDKVYTTIDNIDASVSEDYGK